jgi:hypothetical protein
MVFLAGKLPNIRSYTVYTYGSGQPYVFCRALSPHLPKSVCTAVSGQRDCTNINFMCIPLRRHRPHDAYSKAKQLFTTTCMKSGHNGCSDCMGGWPYSRDEYSDVLHLFASDLKAPLILHATTSHATQQR